MKIVTLEVSSAADVKQRALEAFKGRKQRAHISFATPELLWKVLTAKRWELLKVLAGQDALTIREIARRLDRDVKAVHGDVHALLVCRTVGQGGGRPDFVSFRRRPRRFHFARRLIVRDGAADHFPDPLLRWVSIVGDVKCACPAWAGPEFCPNSRPLDERPARASDADRGRSPAPAEFDAQCDC